MGKLFTAHAQKKRRFFSPKDQKTRMFIQGKEFSGDATSPVVQDKVALSTYGRKILICLNLNFGFVSK